MQSLQQYEIDVASAQAKAMALQQSENVNPQNHVQSHVQAPQLKTLTENVGTAPSFGQIEQHIFTPEEVQIFSDLCIKASGQTPQAIEANQQLVTMIQAVQTPVAFLTQVALTPDAGSEAKCAAVQLLLNQINMSTYAEFSSQVANKVESTFALLVQLLSNSVTDQKLEGLLMRLVCRMAATYWLDNQCFEAFVLQLKYQFQSPEATSTANLSKAQIARLMTELISCINLLVSACENGSNQESEGSVNGDTGSDNPGSDTLNHKAYKTVLLFKNSTLLHIFEVMKDVFVSNLNNRSELNRVVSILTDCLMMHRLELKTGVNQMVFRTAVSEENKAQLQSIRSFCAPQNVCDIANNLILAPGTQPDSDKVREKTVELLRCMLDETKEFVVEAQLQETTESPWSALLATLLKVAKGITSDIMQLSKLLKKVNSTVLLKTDICDKTRQEWTENLYIVAKEATSSIDKVEFGAFANLMSMFDPLIRDASSSPTGVVDSALANNLTSMSVAFHFSLISCLKQGTTFQNDDLFEEHLDNSKAIKEILTSPVRLALLKPSQLLGFIKEGLQEIISGAKGGEKQGEALAWLIHSVRILYSQLISLVKPTEATPIVDLHQERVTTLIEAANLILGLKSTVETWLSGGQGSSATAHLQYALIKAIESVAKSLLSKCLSFGTQEELATAIAGAVGLPSKDSILTSLIELSLVTLASAASTSSNSALGIVEKSALKILVYLTISKPYVLPETQIMQVRYFQIDLQSLISLKDYLCNAIQNAQSVVQRQTIRSLTVLMCEFDTMSETGEVVDAVYSTLNNAISQETCLTKQGTTVKGMLALINDLRGVFEGTYRAKQYMSLVRRFLSDVNGIRQKLTSILDGHCAMCTSVGERALFAKTFLGLIQEITDNRDDRMGFDERTVLSLQYCEIMVNLTQKCLAAIRDLDLTNTTHQGLAMSLLKKSIVICLNLGSNQIMNQKAMLVYTALKDTFQALLSLVLEGLKSFIPPLQINQLKQATQSLVFKFVYLCFERHFGLVLTLAQKDIAYFNYTLQLIGEGLQSTQSCPMLSSFECVELMHNFHMKAPNKIYREAMTELLSTQIETITVFKTLLKQNLRSFLRREMTNREKKVQVTLRIVNMYRMIAPEFYPTCAQEVVLENSSGKSDKLSEQTYQGLIGVLTEIDWNRKRIYPSVKEVVSKLTQNFP